MKLTPELSRRFRFLPACMLLLLSFPLAQPVHAADPHVVLITIDGFPADIFHDPKTSIPHIRKLAAEGVSAEAMHVSNPSVTWPNHTTLVTGVRPAKHSVLFNGILQRPADKPVQIDPKRSKAELVAVPTLFDIFHEAGLRTAAIDWPCTRDSKSLDDDFPDAPDPIQHSTPELIRDLVAQGVLPAGNDAAFRAMNGPARDEVWTRAAVHVIRERQPRFLLLHLLNTDGVHHRYGPQSPASYTAIALADTFVGRVLEAIESSGLRASTTVIVTADHGFATATNILQPNVLLRRAGLLELNASNQIARARVQVVSEGGSGMVYLNDPATRDEDRRKVMELFAGKEGIAEIVQPSEFARFGYPMPDENHGMADLVLAAKDGYGISATATGDDFVVPAGLQTNLGYHGYLSTNPKMNALFVAAGPGLKRGARVGIIENIDVAPTIAHIFGKRLPNADGRVLDEIFAKAK